MFNDVFSVPIGDVWLFVVFAWTIVWKGLGLWKAGRLGKKWWFIAILLLNTLGVLEILYIYVFAKPKGLKNA